MNNIKNLAILFLCGLFLSSCSPNLRPFTKKLQDSYQWNENELKKLQFYLSDDIVLTKNSSRGTSEIKDGKLEVKGEQSLDQVVIRAGTPGVLIISPKANRFAVSFDPENDNNFLMFGANEKQGGRYVLLSAAWNKDNGQITYGGEAYYTPVSSAFAHLLVDIRRKATQTTKTSTLGGRKVD